MGESTSFLSDIVVIYLPKFARKMVYRMILTLFNGRRRIAVVLGVCLVLTITFILNSINYDISLSSRHVITFQANITNTDNTNGPHIPKTFDKSRGSGFNSTTRNVSALKATLNRGMPNVIDNSLNNVRSNNKLNNELYREDILLRQQHEIDTPLQNITHNTIAIGMLKRKPESENEADSFDTHQPVSENETDSSDTHQPELLKSFITKEALDLNTNKLNELTENHFSDKLQFQTQIPNITPELAHSEIEFNKNIIFNRLQQIKNINMQNQMALSYNGFLHKHFSHENFNDAPEKLSYDTFTEKEQNDVTSEPILTNEVRFMRGQSQRIDTNTVGGVNSSVQARRPPTVQSRTQREPVYDSSRNKTKATYTCKHPRKVPTVENILCMERPKFLPNYKNPCWRDNETSSLRCLPYFHIFGTCKSGTTDLFHRLMYHPQIIPNKGILSKETWFWSWKRYDLMIGVQHNQTIPDIAMTFQNFTDFFDAGLIDSFKTGNNRQLTEPYHPLITGHGDPMDIWDFSRWRKISQNSPMLREPEVTTPYLIRHVNPDIKLIALLREPVERTYSQYLHNQYGDSKEAFHFHVVHTINHLKECEKSGRLRACVYQPGSRFQAPIYASLYYLHLTEWLKVFPRNQILLLTTDDYQRDTAGTLSTVFRYLNLDPMPYSDLVKVASRQKQYVSPLKAKLGAMLPQTKALLGKYFEDSIHKLVALLNDTRYLKWIDNSSSYIDVHDTNINILGKNWQQLAYKSNFNNMRNGVFSNSIRGVKLPLNNIPRADLSSDIVKEFQMKSNTGSNSTLNNDADLSGRHFTPSVGSPSNTMYKVRIPSKYTRRSKSLVNTLNKSRPVLNTNSQIRSSPTRKPVFQSSMNMNSVNELPSNKVKFTNILSTMKTKNIITIRPKTSINMPFGELPSNTVKHNDLFINVKPKTIALPKLSN